MRLIEEWNRTRTEYPRNSSVYDLFEREAQARPSREAVRCGTNMLSYDQLNARANQLAHYLMAAGVRPRMTVGLCLERSLELIVAILGVLKTGAAYAPLSSRSPPNRLASMLEDLRVPAVVTCRHFTSKLAEAAASDSNKAAPQIVCLDAAWPEIESHPANNPVVRVRADDVAYISFTSGSTGRPKGVCVTHRGIVRLVRNTDYASFASTEVFLHLAPVSFDASLFEIWGSLLNGARLVLAPSQLPTMSELAQLIRDHGITTTWFTTGLFNQLVEEAPEVFSRLKQVLTGGEAASPFHIRKALGFIGDGRLINGYGPTENSTFTTTYTVPKNFDGARQVPIGKPIANTTCYILHRDLSPVQIGQPGELFAGGDGLTIGYLNRPERTAQRFVLNPFKPGTRLYRTGDKARYLPDGNIEFLGRMDLQVKIRGFRVEPGEIESKLLRHPAVRQCIVTARSDATGVKRLVAYLVTKADSGNPVQEWRSLLGRQVPDYMVPSFFVCLKRLPLTVNGKIDYAALPAPQPNASAKAHAAEPNDALEADLLRIWERVLDVRSIQLNDNFFTLGGHSLLAMRLVAEIEKRLDKKISLPAILENPTIQKIAKALRGELEPALHPNLVPLQPDGRRPPLVLVHGAGGGMFWGYSNLARCLGPAQPVFAFKSRGMEGFTEPETISELAASYVVELLRFQPSGPYYLGGYCFGGLVAYEMAHQLEQANQKVGLLALINTSPPNSGYTRFSWSPLSTCRFAANVLLKIIYGVPKSPEKFRQLIRSLGRLLWRRIATRSKSARLEDGAGEWADLSSYTQQQQQLWQAHVNAWTSYRPQSYSGRVTLFRSPVHQLYCSFDRAYGWRELARGGVDVNLIPSGHDTILAQPHVAILGTALRHRLETAQTS